MLKAKKLKILFDKFKREEPWYYLWDLDFEWLPQEFSPLLIAALNSKNRRVHAGAMLALGHLKELKALPQIMEMLHHKDPKTRLTSTIALRNFDSDRVLTHLIQATKDKNEEVALEAITSLGRLGGELAVPHMVSLLQQEEDMMKITRLLYALGNIKGELATATLVNYLDKVQGNSGLHRAITRSLAKIGSPTAVEPLVNSLQTYYTGHAMADIIRDVATFGKVALPFLLEKVKDEKAVEMAVAVIARIDDDEAINKLLHLSHSLAEEHHLTVINALGIWGSAKAIPLLQQEKTKIDENKAELNTAIDEAITQRKISRQLIADG
jgi:HEAT repeat protein